MRVKVRNLSRYQHYTKRRPPWLKLHRNILDNDYAKLPASAWRLGLEIGLMASEAEDEVVDASPASLSWRLRRRIKIQDVKALIDAAFLIVVQDASNLLAGCMHDGGSEGETETEQRQNKADLPVGFCRFWDLYRQALKLCDRRVAYRKQAVAVWNKRNLEQYADDICNNLQLQIDHYKRASKTGRAAPFPDPQRWLAHDRFNDEIPA